MKKILLFLLIISTFASSVTIKLGSLAPQNSPWDDGLKELNAEWIKATNGQVRLKVYPGGIAGDEADMLKKMKGGLLGGAALTGIGMNSLFPGILAAQLPMMYESQEEFEYVFNKMKPEFDAALQEKGAKIIIWTQIGWVHFFSKGKVVSPSDMSKEKMFVYAGDPEAVKVWRNAGFNPVPLSVNDVMTSLQSGMITSFATTPLSAAALQWFGLAKNMEDMKWAPLMGGVIISTKIWNKIPAETQKELLAIAEGIGTRMQKNIVDQDNQAVSIMKDNGLIVNHVPADIYPQWKQTANLAINEIVGKTIDRESYNKVVSYIKEYRSQNGAK